MPHFFLKILHIIYVAQKINKKEVINMTKTVSLTSTILMTIYTALVTILNLGIFAIAAVLGHLSGSSLTKGLMVDALTSARLHPVPALLRQQ